MNFTGTFPILATPFHGDGSLDLESVDRLVGFMAGLGVDGVTILGMLGESNRMLDRERETLIARSVAAAAGRTRVIVGASHPGTQATIGLCQMAKDLGADAVMIAPSAEPVPNEARVFEYFQQVAAADVLPIVAQDHPASTQVHMSVPLLLRLVDEIPVIACVKEEGLPTPVRIAALKQGMQKRRVPLLTGLGALYGYFDLAAGCDGFNTGFAFPEVLMAIERAARARNLDEAYRLYAKYLPLIVFEQQPGVAVRKELLRLRGLLGQAQVRHPGAAISESAARQLRDILQRVLPGIDITQALQP
ncbi:MAG: dihydrodipicolinate synthase family protein [Burkholderiaceae bacterium]|nr:dihydrodipicolinate synthase family protein [Sulfuritalea sp.]MCF8175294.1 dihydrodipicolinate synthase family protein [Burkholderiaceae bacterium]MCF8184031.1 dihydrodipicolinate synthase family protein [Polynucleobacter sp.]